MNFLVLFLTILGLVRGLRAAMMPTKCTSKNELDNEFKTTGYTIQKYLYKTKKSLVMNNNSSLTTAIYVDM